MLTGNAWVERRYISAIRSYSFNIASVSPKAATNFFASASIRIASSNRSVRLRTSANS